MEDTFLQVHLAVSIVTLVIAAKILYPAFQGFLYLIAV